MSNPQNPVKNPEMGPVLSASQVSLREPLDIVGRSGGEIVFKQSDSQAVINQAIAEGDTMEKRISEFQQVFTSKQK